MSVELTSIVNAALGPNESVESVERLAGDASTRVYSRVYLSSAKGRSRRSLIAMQLPEDAFRSDEASASTRPRELPFLDVHRLLERRGVPVPRIAYVNLASRLVLLEDLGDTTFEARLAKEPDNRTYLYERAVDLLVDMHARCAAPDENCIAYTRSFDTALLRWELDHFREWGLEALHGPLASTVRTELDAHFDALVEAITSTPRGFVHRDYQSRNLMWPHDERLVVIDFQDALLGPAPYDLVALLCDSYVSLPASLQDAMVVRYQRRAEQEELPSFDTRDFWRLAIQRKLKDAGRFVYIDRVRQNASFLRWFPQSLAYVGRAIAHVPDMAALGELLERLVPGFPDRASVPASSR